VRKGDSHQIWVRKGDSHQIWRTQVEERFGQALKIGKDQESEASVGVLVTSSKEQANIPGSLFIPVESAWPVSCVSRNSAKPAPNYETALPISSLGDVVCLVRATW